MSRRISSLFSFFTVHFSVLLLHLLAKLSETESSGSEYLGFGPSLSIIKTGDIDYAFQGYDTYMKNKCKMEKWLADKGHVIDPKSPETDPSVIRDQNLDPMIHGWEMKQMPFEEATNKLHKMYNLSRDHMQTLPGMTMISQMGQKMRDSCMQMVKPVQCDAYSKYRTADGSCNNLQNPSLGSAMTCQQRLGPPNYDGCCGLRKGKDGKPLPPPRILSLKLHFPVNRPSYKWTQMYMFFGQLLDHDMTFTPSSTTVNNQAIQCCPPSPDNHPQCAPIIIPEDDPFYSKFGMTCMNFVRSAPCPSCKMGWRNPMDAVTSFIDASFVYGSSASQTKSLRTGNGTGRMQVEKTYYGDVPPRSPNPEDDHCSIPKENKYCFVAGDVRANQHSPLISLHTIFMREQNRCADKLRYINPHWDGETLFQECRRIVGACMQVITYKEYLPITLGPKAMTKYSLWVGYRTTYNDKLNPTMMVEFTTAAFRFGHSLINSVIANCPLNSTNQRQHLKDDFFRTYRMRYQSVGLLLKGTSETRAQSRDQWKVEDVTNYLYRLRTEQKGLDLAAFNINRGRDHGLPTYVEMVKYCTNGKIVVKCFGDLVKYNLMEKEQADDLRGSYRDVEDVDLWTAILMEKSDDGVVGPTGICIIGKQFYNLKYGDRFYFEHGYQTGSFTDAQLAELRKVTLAKVICLNSDVSRINANLFIFGGPNNPKISCSDVKDIDYWKWKEYYYS